MKVVLRNPHAVDGRDYRQSLSVGAEYEVLGIECDYYRLLTDGGEPVLFDPKCFDVIDPIEPAFWQTHFDDGARYACPPGWGVPGFFEAWHDRDSIIRRVFAAQLGFWYPGLSVDRSPPGQSALRP